MFRISGLISERATPVPIPNTEVKPFSADGTARAAVWESRTRPGFYLKTPPALKLGAFFFVPPCPCSLHFPQPLSHPDLCFVPTAKPASTPFKSIAYKARNY